MKFLLSSVLASGLLLTVAAPTAHAAAAACNFCEDSACANADAHSPAKFYAQVRSSLDKGQFAQVAKKLADDFRSSKIIAKGSERTRFQKNLDASVAEFEAVQASKDRAQLQATAGGVRGIRFNLVTDDEGSVILFKDQGSQRITLTGRTSPAVRKEYCQRAGAMARVLVRYGQDGRARVAAALGNK